MKAYKAREDTLLSVHLGISKAIREEDDNTADVMNRINNLSMANNYIGYRANKYQTVLNIPKNAHSENIGRILKPTFDIDNLEEHPAVRNKNEEDKEADLDDLFERRKLESLKALQTPMSKSCITLDNIHHSITQHQMRVKREMPVLNERQSKKKKVKKPNPLKSELDLELHFKDMQAKRQLMIDRRQDELHRESLELIKAHEVDIRGIECLGNIKDNHKNGLLKN